MKKAPVIIRELLALSRKVRNKEVTNEIREQYKVSIPYRKVRNVVPNCTTTYSKFQSLIGRFVMQLTY